MKCATTEALKALNYDVQAEMRRAVAKFPGWPIDMQHAMGIVHEEIGEMAKDVLQYHYEEHKGKSHATIRAEAVQSICMLQRFVVALDTGHYRAREHGDYTQNPQAME